VLKISIAPLNRHIPQNEGFLSEILHFWTKIVRQKKFPTIFALITADKPRKPACEIKLMLSRVSCVLAQISCYCPFS